MSFQADSFQNDAFQVYGVVVVLPIKGLVALPGRTGIKLDHRTAPVLPAKVISLREFKINLLTET